MQKEVKKTMSEKNEKDTLIKSKLHYFNRLSFDTGEPKACE